MADPEFLASALYFCKVKPDRNLYCKLTILLLKNIADDYNLKILIARWILRKQTRKIKKERFIISIFVF